MTMTENQTVTHAAEAALALTVDRATRALEAVGQGPLAASMTAFRSAQAAAKARLAAGLAEVRAGIADVLADMTGAGLALVVELEIGPRVVGAAQGREGAALPPPAPCPPPPAPGLAAPTLAPTLAPAALPAPIAERMSLAEEHEFSRRSPEAPPAQPEEPFEALGAPAANGRARKPRAKKGGA
jgi:hypothetical protein